MNKTREKLEPVDCLKLIINTLNSPSVHHERVEPAKVYDAIKRSLGMQESVPLLVVTKGGVVTNGIHDLLAAIQTLKPMTFEVARGVPAKRAYRKRTRNIPDISGL